MVIKKKKDVEKADTRNKRYKVNVYHIVNYGGRIWSRKKGHLFAAYLKMSVKMTGLYIYYVPFIPWYL